MWRCANGGMRRHLLLQVGFSGFIGPSLRVDTPKIRDGVDIEARVRDAGLPLGARHADRPVSTAPASNDREPGQPIGHVISANGITNGWGNAGDSGSGTESVDEHPASEV